MPNAGSMIDIEEAGSSDDPVELLTSPIVTTRAQFSEFRKKSRPRENTPKHPLQPSGDMDEHWELEYKNAVAHLNDRSNKFDEWGSEYKTTATKNGLHVIKKNSESGVCRAFSRRGNPPSVLHVMRILDPVHDVYDCNPSLDVTPVSDDGVRVGSRLKHAMDCRPKKWLNDEIINDYISFLNKSAEVEERPVYYLNAVDSIRIFQSATPQSECITSKNRGVDRVTLRQLCDMYALVGIPFSLNNQHWVSAVLHNNAKTGRIECASYDSLGRCLLANFTNKLALALGVELDVKVGGCPAQPDGYECGVLTCLNLEAFLTHNQDSVFPPQISYDYDEVEAHRFLILYRILGCIKDLNPFITKSNKQAQTPERHPAKKKTRTTTSPKSNQVIFGLPAPSLYQPSQTKIGPPYKAEDAGRRLCISREAMQNNMLPKVDTFGLSFVGTVHLDGDSIYSPNRLGPSTETAVSGSGQALSVQQDEDEGQEEVCPDCDLRLTSGLDFFCTCCWETKCGECADGRACAECEVEHCNMCFDSCHTCSSCGAISCESCWENKASCCFPCGGELDAKTCGDSVKVDKRQLHYVSLPSPLQAFELNASAPRY